MMYYNIFVQELYDLTLLQLRSQWVRSCHIILAQKGPMEAPRYFMTITCCISLLTKQGHLVCEPQALSIYYHDQLQYLLRTIPFEILRASGGETKNVWGRGPRQK